MGWFLQQGLLIKDKVVGEGASLICKSLISILLREVQIADLLRAMQLAGKPQQARLIITESTESFCRAKDVTSAFKAAWYRRIASHKKTSLKTEFG